MTKQTRIDPKAALAALDQAYAYYQPEPLLVQGGPRAAVEDVRDETDGFAYYHAA
ncbi:hypothetical protein [Salipiger aestuarii]|uniref:hypothetical protein n=1 Tax=Salipiger aestuarii TaxID=568098 RepID=UPI00025B65C5|nr:hypothetical protein [Salipiger aestuarii]EIE48884.1 hypothetical protein C357_22030 [Citreicella sp. 357]